MLLGIALILLALWAFGFLVFHLGALIHLVLVVAIAAFVWHLVAGRARTTK